MTREGALSRARCHLRFVVGTDRANLPGNLRRRLDAHGLGRVLIETPDPSSAIFLEATRTDPDHPFARQARDAVTRAAGQPCAVLASGGGANVTEIVQYDRGLPCVRLPPSHAARLQHAPDEHILKPGCARTPRTSPASAGTSATHR